MKKIIVLTENFFTLRDVDRMGIKYLKNFFSVDIIDLTYYFNKKYFIEKYDDIKHKVLVKEIRKVKDFYKYIKNSNNIILAIDHLGLHSKSNNLRIFLSSVGIKVLRLNCGSVPEKTYFRNTKKLLSKGKFFKIYSKTISFFQNHSKVKNYRKNVDLDLVSGLVSEKASPNKKLYGHSFDYGSYLNNSKNVRLIKKPYAVFLDEMIPNTPEYLLIRHAKPISYNLYWEKISVTLEKIRKKLKMDIIVALHPRNSNKNKYLKNFICKKYVTANLVINSELALLHTSTAVSYTIITKKPLIYLNSEKYSFQANRIKYLHEVTGGTLLNVEENIENQIDEKSLYKIDKKKYNNYLDNYLKHPLSKNLTVPELIKKYVQTI